MLSRRLLRIKVVKALYWHFKSGSESPAASEKNLAASIDKVYDLYLQMLFLVVDLARYADRRMELAKNKKLPTAEDLDPNTKFVKNALVGQIEADGELSDRLRKGSLGWHKYPELIKSLYDSMIRSDYYKSYMESPARSYKEDLRFVENFYTGTIEDNEDIAGVLEEQSILWIDDMDFALIMVMRTIGNCKAGQVSVPLLPKYKNDGDREFAGELFRRTLVNYGDHQAYVERFTENWDIERIAFLDNIIMAAAIAELTSFASIPVRVTLDEYIEIAKYYSTPGSSQFINGMLDRVVAELEKENKINKTGRGLM